MLAKVARARFKKFLQGRTSTRIPAPMFFAIVAYLEKEQQVGGYLASLPDADHIADSIQSKYLSAMADILLPGAIVEEGAKLDESDFLAQYLGIARTVPAILNGSAHGSMFHLGMLAYYTSTDRIKNTEKARWVGFYNDVNDRNYKKHKKRYLRNVDIILNTGGDTGSDAESWIELKSLQRKSLTDEFKSLSDGFKTWGGPRGASFGFNKITYHKQFTLDRAAWKENAKYPIAQGKGESAVPVISFEWIFHRFEVKAQPKYRIKEAKSVKVGVLTKNGNIRERLSSQVDGRAGQIGIEALKFSLGLEDGKQTQAQRLEVARKINGFSILRELTNQLKSRDALDNDLFDVLDNLLTGDPT